MFQQFVEMKKTYRPRKALKIPKIVRIKHFVVGDAKDLVTLEDPRSLGGFSVIYEDDKFYYAVGKNVDYCVRKEEYKPSIFKAGKISVDPSSTSVYVDLETIMRIAYENEMDIFETPDCYVILTNGLTIFCKKDEGHSVASGKL